MNFLFHCHSDPSVLTLNVDEQLPINQPDILPADLDGEREKAEKHLLAAHTKGGMLINREKAGDAWVNKCYKALLEIPGIASMAVIDCYTIMFHKGSIFDWKQIKKQIPEVLAANLNGGELVGKVLDGKCPDCFGGGGHGNPMAALKMALGGGSRTRDDEPEEKDPETEVQAMVERLLERAERVGAFVCCVVDHPAVGNICAERLPKEHASENLASFACSEFYDGWAKKREQSPQS